MITASEIVALLVAAGVTSIPIADVIALAAALRASRVDALMGVRK